MSSRTRESKQKQRRDRDQVSRLGSLRMVLVFLTVIPSMALLGLWGLSTAQLGIDWQRLAHQDDLYDRSSTLARNVTAQLQEERRLTGQMLAVPGASQDAVKTQRKHTDVAIKAFLGTTDGDLSSLPRQGLRDAVTQDRHDLGRLDGIRAAVDQHTITDEISVQSYTGLIESNLGFFEAFGHADNEDLADSFKPLTDLMWADEMLSREDAVLSYSWAADEFRDRDRTGLSQWIGAQHFLIESEITNRVSLPERAELQDLEGNNAWDTKEMVESALIGHHPTDPELLPWTSSEWRHAMQTLKPRFDTLIQHRSTVVEDVTDESVDDLKGRMRTYAVICLGTVVVVIALSVVLTNSLRRRILGLRDEAARLETELPGVMARLRRGEDVDVEKEVREVRHGQDEMGKLGQALNLARRTAVETAVRETEQHRGFQRMLQRIARRTQLLIGLQLKKLDEMERGQEDPEILEGLFDLDHLTSRLRRYEENLVVLGGGQPQRRWRRPVRVIDVLRAALGEVQDYRRISIEVAEESWLAGRAIGPLVHILAELMENAAAFSKPPNPVEARATLVGRGLAVEVEDRGLGMDAEDYDALNAMMAEPPELDVVSRAEDARLGLYVVSQLASSLGLKVEFRASVYGGTRVIVMVPEELVAEPPEGADDTESRGVRATTPVTGADALSGGPAGDLPGEDLAGTPAAGAPTGGWPAPAGHSGVLAGYPGIPDHGGANEQVVPDGTGSGWAPHDGFGASVPRPRDPYTEHARAEAAQPEPAAPAHGTLPADAARHPATEYPAQSDPARYPAGAGYPGAAAPAGAQTGGDAALPPQGASAPSMPGLPARARGRALDAVTASGSRAGQVSSTDGPQGNAGAGQHRGPRDHGTADQAAHSGPKHRRVAPEPSEDVRTGVPPGPPGGLPQRARGVAADPGDEEQTAPGLTPLPKRVRQANLAPGLKEPPRPRRHRDDEPPDPQDDSRSVRSGAAIGAFQRQSRLNRGPARAADDQVTPDVTDAMPDTRSSHTEDAP